MIYKTLQYALPFMLMTARGHLATRTLRRRLQGAEEDNPFGDADAFFNGDMNDEMASAFGAEGEMGMGGDVFTADGVIGTGSNGTQMIISDMDYLRGVRDNWNAYDADANGSLTFPELDSYTTAIFGANNNSATNDISTALIGYGLVPTNNEATLDTLNKIITMGEILEKNGEGITEADKAFLAEAGYTSATDDYSAATLKSWMVSGGIGKNADAFFNGDMNAQIEAEMAAAFGADQEEAPELSEEQTQYMDQISEAFETQMKEVVDTTGDGEPDTIVISAWAALDEDPDSMSEQEFQNWGLSPQSGVATPPANLTPEEVAEVWGAAFEDVQSGMVDDVITWTCGENGGSPDAMTFW